MKIGNCRGKSETGYTEIGCLHTKYHDKVFFHVSFS